MYFIISILTTAFCIFLFGGIEARGEMNTLLEIIHLKQLHAIPGIPEYDGQKDICVKVARAQYNLAIYLAQHPDIPVVQESLYDDIDCINSSGLCKVVREVIFLNGLPDRFEDLSNLQKAFLYEEGAALALTYMGILPTVYKSIEQEDSDRIDAIVNQLSYEEMFVQMSNTDAFGDREKFALDHAVRAAQLHYGDINNGPVFIVFGGHHDFKKECNEYGFELKEVITTEKTKEEMHYLIGQSDYTKSFEADISANFNEPLKQLVNWHPYHLNKLINSEHINIQELDEFASNHFEILRDIVRVGNLVDFMSVGVLLLPEVLDVYHSEVLRGHLRGIVKDALLNREITFAQLLKMSSEALVETHKFKTTQELAQYVDGVQCTVASFDRSWLSVFMDFGLLRVLI